MAFVYRGATNEHGACFRLLRPLKLSSVLELADQLVTLLDLGVAVSVVTMMILAATGFSALMMVSAARTG